MSKSALLAAITALISTAALLAGCVGGPDESDEIDVPEVVSTPQGKGNNQCAIKCAAPPDGCHYEGAVTSGPCHKLTCGTLVCDGTL